MQSDTHSVAGLATVAFSRWRFNVSGLHRPHAEDPMIYEQRIYTCIPGRLPALLKRFEEQTLKIWDKHGIKQAGFWTVLVGDGSQDLHYMLVWESLADREKKWNTFQADPAWHKARDESETSGPIIANIKSAFLRPTAFSAVK